MNNTGTQPQYLYHYTTVDTLELILENRTFRFNPLTNMDDTEEQWCVHGKAHGHFFFVSSWTESEEEIKRMWKEYCKPNPARGVRIKLPVTPFSEKEFSPTELEREYLYEMKKISSKYFMQYYDQTTPDDLGMYADLYHKLMKEHPDVKPLIEKEKDELEHKTVICRQRIGDLLRKVDYTNDRSKLFPVIMGEYQEIHFEDYSNFGRYKKNSWAWQKEWRYLMHFQRMVPGKILSNGNIELYKLPFEYYDLKLDEDKIKELEVTTSPVISNDAMAKLHEILELYCPTAVVETSQFGDLN